MLITAVLNLLRPARCSSIGQGMQAVILDIAPLLAIARCIQLTT
jgi:hypothetical protein